MQQFSSKEIDDLKSRIDEIHELLASRGGDAAVIQLHGESLVNLQESRSAKLSSHLLYSIQIRRIRKSHFHNADVSGPTWDMMLDLMMAERNGRELSASDLATGAGVPLSSGLRMIASIEVAGFARRFTDPRDRRRSLVRLTETGREKMISYFEKANTIWNNALSAAS